MNPLIVLVVGLLLFFAGVTGRAEAAWVALSRGIPGTQGRRPSRPAGKAAPR